MKEANPGLLVGQVPSNPLSINIEFNINNSRTPATDLTHMIRGKKLQSDMLNLKSHHCACHVSKTPELAQTDRDAYSKEMEYLKPVDDRKRKSKRNSMDINIPNRSINEWTKAKFTKGNTTVLKKTDLSFKNDTFKKKRTPFKNDFEPYRRSLQVADHVKGSIQGGTQKKTFHKSLKNIIHKIVNSQLSKRSLSGISYNKNKSPYQAPSFALNNNTARKRTNKKKNLSCKSERGLTSRDPEEIVEKLNSLKSMTNSILRSEMEQFEMPYYSKQKGRIHIKTDQSIDLIQQIALYEKKPRRTDQRRDINYKGAVEQTNKLIQTYIHLMNEQSHNSQNSSSLDIQNQSIPEQKKHAITYQNPIRKTISNQMRELFSDIPQDVTEELSAIEKSQNKPTQKPPLQFNQENANKLRAFLSSEMERPATVSNQLQRLKFQQLKKQQIQKWGYLLQFIKKNMHSDEADTETVLNQVYWFLQRSKNDLQREMHADLSIEHHKKEIDEQFTVKYSQKREENAAQQYYQQEQSISKESEEVKSFKEEYTEENQDLKLLSLQTISSALKQRQLGLDKQREKQISTLQQKLELGKITEEQYDKQLERIDKWNKKELAEIRRAKKNIWKGYHEAKGVLDKTVNSRYYEKRQNNTKKMMKCLSQTYLKKHKYDYKAIFNKQESNKSSKLQSSDQYQSEQFQRGFQEAKTPSNQFHKEQQHPHSSQSSPQSQDPVPSESSRDPQLQMSGQLINSKHGQLQQLNPQPEGSEQQNRSQEMQQIKQRLLRMKRQHYGLQEDHQSQQALESHINYEEIEKSLEQEYSDQEISIINKEVGQSFLPVKNSEMDKYKQLQNKLKYCCSQDKEDIFQFIFLDLCIELYQQPCKDNKIMKAVNTHVNRVKNQAKKKKGVKTNLNVVKEYLKRFSAFLLRTNKNCLQGLNIPMGPSALQMLRYMHDSDYDIPEQQQEIPTLIIPITVFDKFQQSLLPTLQFEEYYDDPEKEEARINFLKTILHIHNKALFDSLNQFMDHERPFGIWGKPFPWKKSSCFTHNFSEIAKEDKLKKSVQKVIEQCSYVCGLLVDKQQSLVGSAKISQAYVQQIRQDRLSRMLANQLVESEQRWLFYDDEETQVLVQISTYVWNLLLYEARNQINALRNS